MKIGRLLMVAVVACLTASAVGGEPLYTTLGESPAGKQYSGASETYGDQQCSAYMATSSACATIRCSYSTSTAIWSGPCCGVATTTGPSSGDAFCPGHRAIPGS